MKPKVKVNYDKDLVSLRWGRDEFKFNLIDGDVGDFWHSFKVGGHEYYISFWSEEGWHNEPTGLTATFYPADEGKILTDKVIECEVIEAIGDVLEFMKRYTKENFLLMHMKDGGENWKLSDLLDKELLKLRGKFYDYLNRGKKIDLGQFEEVVIELERRTES